METLTNHSLGFFASSTLTLFVTILYLGCIIHIILNKPNIGEKILWLAAVFGLPVFGVLCYLGFGRKQLSMD